MEVAELEATDTPDVMQPEDSVNAIIRQAAASESLLCFPRGTDNTEQWLQLLHVLDNQGWPLLCSLNCKFPSQKCDKCSQEFCSVVNYRRHLRVHNRFQKLDKKDSRKTREALGAYWDKLSVEEAKEVVSFENAKLEDVAGSSLLNALNTVVEKHGFFLIPVNYVTAGAALLDVLKCEASSIPISSEDLFRILDETSEKTCFLGTAVSMQKYVFDGDAAKVCLELKNLVACASFLLEQNLTKAWIAYKNAESLRCQNQLVEEETAAQKRQDEISKKKIKKKLRQNQQNAKEQRHRDEVETKGNFESTVKTLSPEASLDTYDSETNNPEKFSSDSPSHVPSESADTDEGTDGIIRSGYTFDTDQNIETQSEQGQSQWHIVQKKAREQRNKGGAEIKKNVDSTLKALSPAKVSLDTYIIGAHNPKKIANGAPSHVPSQHPDTNKGSDGDVQSGKDVGTGIVQKKAREQRIKGGAEIKGNVDSTLKALSPAKISFDTYIIGAHEPKKIANGAPSHVPSQHPNTNEGSDGDAQSWKDAATGIVQKKAREQRIKGGAEIKGNVDSTLKALSPAKVSLDTYKIGAHNPKKIANDAPSHVPSQHPDTNKGSDGDAQSWKDVATGIVQKKAREQRIKGGAEIKGNVDSTLKALSPAKISSDTNKIGVHNPKKFANGTPSHVPSQNPETNEGADGDTQSGKDDGTGIVQKTAREQRIGGGADIKGNVDSTLKALSPEKISSDTYKIGAHNPKKVANDTPSHVLSQNPETNEGADGDTQSGKDDGTRIVQKTAKEQRIKGGEEIKGNVDRTLKALSPAKTSSDTYKIGAHNPKKVANDTPSPVPSQNPETNEGADGDTQSGKDDGTSIVQKTARKQRIKGGAEIKENVDSTLKALSPAKTSSDTYKIGAHNPKELANDAPPHAPSQCSDTNEGSYGDTQPGKDVGTEQNIERQSEHGHNHGDVEVARGKGLPKSEPAVASDLHTNQNSIISKLEVMEKDGTQGDQSVAAIANGDKAKPKREVNSVALKTIEEKEPDLVKNYEVLIGSISVDVNCRKSGGNVLAARKDCMVGNVANQNTFPDKPIKTELVESGTKQSTVEPQMPTSQLETKDPLPVQSGGTEVDAGYANEDRQDLSGPRLRIFSIFKESFISDLEGGMDPGSSPLPFYIEAAHAFLELRFTKAMSSDHVVLVVSNDSECEPSECKETLDMKIEKCQSSSGADSCNNPTNAENKSLPCQSSSGADSCNNPANAENKSLPCQSSSGADSCNNPANAENKSLPTSKVSNTKHRKKSGEGVKAKNTPKQKTDT